ncbi:hypothetical protein TrLO_g83 [Triparma laevis f. longispina]|nr:hypothetical protein TrLO_g83 [Triparma laevis f. longispina]
MEAAMNTSDDSYTFFIQNFARIACSSHPTQTTAIYLLKNKLSSPPTLLNSSPPRPTTLSPSSHPEIKALILYCLSSPSPIVSNGASSLISTVTAQTKIFDIQSWPELLPLLITNVNSQDVTTKISAFKTIKNIAQDSPNILDAANLTPDRPLNTLIPAFINHFAHPEPKLKILALQSIMAYVELFPEALASSMNETMSGLSAIAADPNQAVRKRVCETIFTLFTHRSDYLQGQLPSICEFMISSASDSVRDISLVGTEFWLTFFDPTYDTIPRDFRDDIVKKQGVVERLLPGLLKNIVYCEEERENILERNKEDEALAAAGTVRQLEAPVHHKNKNDDDDDDEDEDAGFDDGEDQSWSLRKASAGTIDCIAQSVDPRALLSVLLPTLQSTLSSQDPWVLEASLLTLGAIAVGGCGQIMEVENLNDLYPFLISQLNSSLPQVVATAAWTLSRYCGWIVYMAESQPNGPQMLKSHIEVILQACNSPNTKVQNAAMTSFSNVVDMAGPLIQPLLPSIYQFLASALTLFGGKPLITLYDTLGILADSLGSAIGENGMANTWVPILMEKWRVLHEQSKAKECEGEDAQALIRQQLLPLLECIACSAVALGLNYQPFALVSLDRSIEAIDFNMLRVVTLRHTDDDRVTNDEEMDSDVIICCLDVIDGMVEGLGANFAGLLAASEKREQFLPMLQQSCLFDVGGVRMSGLAVLGDLCANSPATISPAFSELVKVIVQNLNSRRWSKVVNNALWSFGELCNQCIGKPQGLLPFQEKLLSAIIPLVLSGQVGIVENASTALGRLARVDNAGFGMGRVLLGKIDVWLQGVAMIADRTEKCQAMTGLLLTVRAFPDLLMSENTRISSVTAFMTCVSSFHVRVMEGDDFRPLEHEDLHHATYTFLDFPRDDEEFVNLFNMIGQITNSVVQGMSGGREEVAKCMRALPMNVRRLFREVYGVNA